MEVVEAAGTMQGDLCRGLWTNEKHVNFLNWMEDSFVRTMLEKNNNNRKRSYNTSTCSSSSVLTYATSGGGGRGVAPLPSPPLDRCLPDSSESTCDSRYTNKRTTTSSSSKKMHLSVPTDQNMTTSSSRKGEMKMTCRSSQPHDASGDQVVPQIEKIRDDNEELMKREKELELDVSPNKKKCY